jgi:peroxiredoxin
VVIHADLKDLINSLKIEGSQQSEWIYESNVKLNTFKAKLDSINTLYMQLAQKGISDSVKQKLTKDYMSIDSLQIQYLVTFIKDHAESLSCLYIIDRLSIDTYFSTYEVLDSKLYAKYPDNTFAKNFHTRVEGAKKLAIGSVAPEIELPNPDGQNVKLSSLRGKVVLIDFWASWCSPCRRENPNMVRIYKNYNAKGFEIFSVSLDKTKDAWVKAIQDDGLTWTHVSDLKFWQCEAALAYNVTAVPYTVLLDKEGKIVAKGLRGAELEAKLSELFE